MCNPWGYDRLALLSLRMYVVVPAWLEALILLPSPPFSQRNLFVGLWVSPPEF